MIDRSTLEEQLRARYSDRLELKKFLRRKLDRNLDDYAGTGGLDDVVFELVEYAEAKGWSKDLADAVVEDRRAEQAGGMPAVRDLLDLSAFDLQPLEDAFVDEQVSAGSRRVIGVAVAAPDNRFVRFLCARLQTVLGRVSTYVDTDGTTLNPDVSSVEIALRQVLVQDRKLQLKNVVCPVWCERADQEAIKSFWTRVRQEFSGSQRYLVLVLVINDDAAVPAEICALPRPTITEKDLTRWTVKVSNELGWPPDLAAVWSRQLVTSSTIGQEINVSIIYTLMDSDVTRVLRERTSLEHDIRKLMEEMQ